MALCRTAAIAMHYFVLAMFFWTSIQAYNMYLSFVKVMPRYYSKFMLKCCVVGWGLYFEHFFQFRAFVGKGQLRRQSSSLVMLCKFEMMILFFIFIFIVFQ